MTSSEFREWFDAAKNTFCERVDVHGAPCVRALLKDGDQFDLMAMDAEWGFLLFMAYGAEGVSDLRGVTVVPDAVAKIEFFKHPPREAPPGERTLRGFGGAREQGSSQR